MDTLDTLEQALAALSHQELLNLVLKLSSEEAEFHRLLLANLNISEPILKQQLQAPFELKALMLQISNVFSELQELYQDEYYDREYDENEEYRELTSIIEKIKTMEPADRVEVFWHLVTCGNEMFEDEEYIMGTVQIEEAIGLYAEAIAQLDPPHRYKREYLDSLVDALDWDMCLYGNVTDAIESALDSLCTVPDDYYYLIKKIQSNGYNRANELISSYYLALGDDANYLQIRQANLQTEGQYLELAEYCRQKDDEKQYIATLEEWVSTLGERKESSQSQSKSAQISYGVTAASSPVLQALSDHYRQQQDDENLCRILMTMAEYTQVTLELYQQIKAVAQKLGQWSKLQPNLIKFALRDSRKLVEIYLYEQNWDAAIKLAQQKKDDFFGEEILVRVAEVVKEHRPEAAIAMYQHLVQKHIDRKSREHYQNAAGYARAIKLIYLSILQDQATWQRYIVNIRARYPRHRALQEEFKLL